MHLSLAGCALALCTGLAMAVPSKPHQVLRIVPKTPAELQALGSLGFEDPDLVRPRSASAFLPPHAFLSLGPLSRRAIRARGRDASARVPQDWWRPPSAVGQPAALHLTPGSARG
jgi:hypothetical protein